VFGRLVPRCGMTDDNATYPYTLTIFPSERTAGHFDWAICRHGTLVERSDRLYSSERSARESGEAALERQLRDDREPKHGFQPRQQGRLGPFQGTRASLRRLDQTAADPRRSV
jgi:hypothetical protein